MVSGLYTARDGMMLLQQMVDNTSNNLANANTTGFKRALMSSMAQVGAPRDDEQKLRHNEEHWMAEGYVTWEQGSLIQTENPLDLGLEGNGLFMVETPQGTRYTRAGSFTLNGDGDLVNMGGHKVLDSSGQAIHIGQGGDIEVSSAGIIKQGGKFVAQLGIKDFEDRRVGLVREGNSLFRAFDIDKYPPKTAQDFNVRQGVLEGSNANAVEGMIELIRFSRNFEFDRTAVNSIDSTLEKAVNEIGRVQ